MAASRRPTEDLFQPDIGRAFLPNPYHHDQAGQQEKYRGCESGTLALEGVGEEGYQAMADGHIVGEFDREAVTEEAIMRAIQGH